MILVNFSFMMQYARSAHLASAIQGKGSMVYLTRLVAIVGINIGVLILLMASFPPPVRYMPTYTIEYALGVPHIVAALLAVALLFFGIVGGGLTLFMLRPRKH